MKPTRVLVLTTYYHPILGGVETHARQLVRGLCARGFDVQVVTKRVDRSHPVDDVVDDVPVHRVRPTGDRRGIGKWLALPFFLSKIVALRDACDVIVCIDYRGIGVAAVVAGAVLRRAVTVQAGTAGVLASTDRDASSRSGVPPETIIVRLLKAPARSVYRRADHVVCMAHDIEREALAAGFPRERVHYLPHGVDVHRFRPASPEERKAIRTAEGWPLDRPVVLFVGRLSIEKGVMDLLEGWPLLDDARAELVLVGPDMPAHRWDAGALARSFVAAHGLADRVRFHGPSDDPAPLFRAADLFVQPSQFEGFGISVIEAMASGVAVVASEVGGMLDFLVHGDNALLHAPRSPSSIATALRRALCDVSLRVRLADAGLKTVREQFDEERLLDRYAQLVESAAREPH
jgi:glycosyltransferase involved in cell wall biosynthesis